MYNVGEIIFILDEVCIILICRINRIFLVVEGKVLNISYFES